MATLVDAMRNSAKEGGGLPTDVEYMVSDTMEQLRPELKLVYNLKEAQESVEKLEKELRDSYC